MNPVALARPRSYAEASALTRDARFSLPVIKAGGMDLVDHMKEGIVRPDLLVDVLPLRSFDGPKIAVTANGLRIEATTTLAELAASDDVKRVAPALAQAAGSAASPQIRNVATAAGNLLQRPRCWYYRHQEFDCLKKSGHKCYAVDGENTYHAVFSDGPCYIVHPSNLAPALQVLGGRVRVERDGAAPRTIAIDDLYHEPGDGPRSEHELDAGDVITSIELEAARHSGFYAVKSKQSFDWPLVFATAALDLDGSTIRAARICAGAVAPVPWPLPKVAKALVGVSVNDDAALRRACAGAADGAKPLSDNGYKTTLLPVAVRRAVRIAAGLEVTT